MSGADLAQRLTALFDHLGIVRAHVGCHIPGDLAGFVAAAPERVGGIVMCVPVRLDPEPFKAVADRVLMIAGEYGPTFEATLRAMPRLPGASRLVLDGYEAQGWADVVADRTGEVIERMVAFLQGFGADPPGHTTVEGHHAGIDYRIEGSGPALVLFPFYLAPSQWDPGVAELTQHFTVVRLGGRHLGGVAQLEARAATPTYRAMFNTIIDLLDVPPNGSVLDVGCGSGSLDQLLAQRLGASGVMTTACDANPFLLREAQALAAADGVAERIRFQLGNAEALPFPDASFDAVFSVTVLEECDADRAIAEMMRVVKPGRRIAVVVRAIDLPQWWGFDLPEAIRRKVTMPPHSVGQSGVADAGLYRRMTRAGLTQITGFPFLVTFDQPEGPIWRYREDHALSLLTAEEREIWSAAKREAAASGPLLAAHPLHCAIGTKPG